MENEKNLSPVFLKQFGTSVEKVLHRPGNFPGKILEMTIVIDFNVEKEILETWLPQAIQALKRQDEVFRNVRLNLVGWKSDSEMKSRVSTLTRLTMSRFYSSYRPAKEEKTLEKLYASLKAYHARSKIILLLTDGSNVVRDKEISEQEKQPFLGKKLLQLILTPEGIEVKEPA